jgi:Multicopper oxidase
MYEQGMPLFGSRHYSLTSPGEPIGGPLGAAKLVYNDEMFSGEIGQVGTQFDGLGHIGTLIGDEVVYYNGLKQSDVGGTYGLQKSIPTAAAGTLDWAQSRQNVATTEESSGSDRQFVETFKNPPEVSSAGGILNLTLTAEPTAVETAGQRVQAKVYNGLYIPPTLRVQPGDTMPITLINAIGGPTNLHHHGSNVSPRNTGDNVFVDLLPGQIFNQQIAFPPEHPPGFLWYHPHRHMFVESQIFGGMSGGLIVEGMLEPFPLLQGVQERIMLLKDFQHIGGQIPSEDIDSNAGTTRTINGMVNPTLRIRPGETQFWRIANIGADIYYRFWFTIQLPISRGYRKDYMLTGA